ncbi:hypothetical protein K9N08_03305 [Candidatus Gracilibacteria bacterium]|nr:hypothetical protein [Candidatus Gracilibacteria bacterium]MCF7856558.1 hypothetical protein [Candidatus Gracilibacteria bacterium]MCF7896847.1 hypothetical protein [Candidatus Gracilibacteria bacterium]
MNSHSHITHRNHLAAVGYIPLVNFLILYAHRGEKFVVEHSINGILLSIYFALAYFLIPDFGVYVALIFIATAIAGFIHASAGKKYPLPLLNDFVEWLAERF